MSATKSLSASYIPTLFLFAPDLVTGLLPVQSEAAASFEALGFTGDTTKDGRPRFALYSDRDVLEAYLDSLRWDSKILRSFNAVGRDIDACVPYLGRPAADGYAGTLIRRAVFKAVYGEALRHRDDLDHICHTDETCSEINSGDMSTCAHRMCINPYHFAVATREENIARSTKSRTRDLCKRGHEYTVTPSGKRCNECRRMNRDEINAGRPVRGYGTDTHCLHGHERAVHGKRREGSFNSGAWYCNRCNTDAVIARQRAKKNSR